MYWGIPMQIIFKWLCKNLLNNYIWSNFVLFLSPILVSLNHYLILYLKYKLLLSTKYFSESLSQQLPSTMQHAASAEESHEPLHGKWKNGSRWPRDVGTCQGRKNEADERHRTHSFRGQYILSLGKLIILIPKLVWY